MFRRLTWDDFMRDAHMLGLLLLGLAIVVLIARLRSMPREEIQRISELPLNDD